ncbi:hypothetical protein BBJ28_00025160 [Nothophytophthora sp. Chile5]|nr:hypothetical protein BBJ28_00025160 [Nothophytophthora sp. Chile5]
MASAAASSRIDVCEGDGPHPAQPARAVLEPSVVGRLRKVLHERVTETVSSVCGAFELELERAAQPPPSLIAADAEGYDVYNDCCQRLVAYIVTNMVTSPHFVQQMDRIILACHSNMSKQMLSSLVTKDVWCHSVATNDAAGNRRSESHVLLEGQTPAEPVVAFDVPEHGESTATSLPVNVINTSETPPATPVTATPPTVRRSNQKRVLTAGCSPAPQGPPKRSRHDVVRTLYSGADSQGNNAEEKGGGVEVEAGNGDSETETETEGDEERGMGAEECVEDRQRHGREDNVVVQGVTTTECPYSIEGRSLEQTVLLKKQLRKAIEFVDAKFCNPPVQKVCAHDCEKIRTQTCRNPMRCLGTRCCMWHDSGAHADCCQNSRCEFKNRIFLRETMHKIQQKELDVEKVNAKLEKKKRRLAEMMCTRRDGSHRVFSSAVKHEREIAQLERKCANEGDHLAFLNSVRRVFWDDLDAIGVHEEDDEADGFPDFVSHYVPE